ncbi:MAG: arginine:agmatine antiporter, partial [Lentisphaeria bacterium]|nr:arginine:agmatine antiporter [Lentisphaeria bacterium]
KYLAMAFIFLAIGVPFYLWARRDSDAEEPPFSIKELGCAILIFAVAIFSMIAVINGRITL